MEDKVDELINLFGKNKKSLVYMIILYVIIMIGVIVYIWWPKGKDYATYEKIDISNKKTQLAQSYINSLADLFKNNKTDEVSNLISSEYLAYTGKSRQEIITEIQNAGFFSSNVNLKGMNVYEDGDTYVFSTTMYSGNNSKSVNVIESKPYEYTIVFDDFYSYSIGGKTTTNKNIKFTTQEIYNNLKYVEIDMSITNNNDTYARFNFNSPAAVQAVLADGTKYSLANAVSSEEYTNIESNMTVKKTFVFEIPIQLQQGIEYIIFNGVSLEFSSTNMKVEI